MQILVSCKKDIPLKGEIEVASDKSISHRSLIFAALANGKTKINKLLESIAFKQNLKSHGIEIIKFSEAKQTETTQRWKLSLKITGESLPIATKIEFSRRTINDNFKLEPVDQEIIQLYKLYPIITNHYLREEAFNQKVNALINRTETQARDIFDLNLLGVLQNSVFLPLFLHR